jgi:hypothetical protein
MTAPPSHVVHAGRSPQTSNVQIGFSTGSINSSSDASRAATRLTPVENST